MSMESKWIDMEQLAKKARLLLRKYKDNLTVAHMSEHEAYRLLDTGLRALAKERREE